MLINGNIEKLAKLGVIKAHELQALIDVLNNTTVGELNSKVNSLESKVSALEDKNNSLESEVNSLKQRLENYENHNHGYEDTTINDTADGSGTPSTTNKTTGGVN